MSWSPRATITGQEAPGYHDSAETEGSTAESVQSGHLRPATILP